MAFDTVVGYTFNADTHCPECTRQYFSVEIENAAQDVGYNYVDEHGIPLDLWDSESNPVHVIFPSAEFDYFPACGDCREPIDAVNLSAL